MAAVPDGLVPDTAADLVERGVGEPHDVEGVRDLAGVGWLLRCRRLLLSGSFLPYTQARRLQG